MACYYTWMRVAASTAATLPTPRDPRTAVTARVPQVRAWDDLRKLMGATWVEYGWFMKCLLFAYYT